MRSGSRNRVRIGACLIGCFAWAHGAAGVRAQHDLHGAHPPMPDQRLYFQYTLHDGARDRSLHEPIRLESTLTGSTLNQRVATPESWPTARLAQYLPKATLVQKVVPDDTLAGRPAVQLAIEGPAQRYDRWMIADDPDRNRMISFIATWRLMGVANDDERAALFGAFEGELRRPPVLRVRRIDDKQDVELPVSVGDEHQLRDLGCRVRVRAFYPDFGRDSTTQKPVNKSDTMRNPAALIELRAGSLTEERWVFAKFPDFTQDGSTVPIRVVLDCPVNPERTIPDFSLVVLERRRLEVWRRFDGKTTAQKAAEGDTFAIDGSQYVFRIAAFVGSGRLTERYEAADRGVAALSVEIVEGERDADAVWLELGKPRTLNTAKGSITVSFGPLPIGEAGHP